MYNLHPAIYQYNQQHFYNILLVPAPIAYAVFAKIKPYLDSNNRLLVIEVVNNKQGWLNKKQWDFINNSIFG